MSYAIYFALFLPLAGFLVLTATAKVIGRWLTGLIACSTVFVSLLCFISLLAIYLSTGMEPRDFILFNWISIEKINADFALHLDSLSLLMTLIVTGVGFLILVYSNGYMEHDEDFARFFAFMNFFVFSMLLLVLAANLLLFFVGWEGVGLASYLLIGFWYQNSSFAQAATKAFVINRICDLGLLLGVILTFYLFGTSDIAEISRRAGQEFAVGATIITVVTLLYFVGSTGKSAQLPLYSWLPDAMAGPTPVSALIHAATMVTAGVYLVVRMHVLFMLAPITLQVVGIIGAATSLFAALCALSQTDLKRVLAYSTVSQLGLMFLACGAGAFYSAMFHLTAHAFIKALLFLSAGNVVHMLHDITEMDRMGGLSKIFNKTHWLFLLGSLALAGIPPFIGFFSKDLILEQEFESGYIWLFSIGLAAAILTGIYLIRAYCLTFMGSSRMGEKELKTVREAPKVMLIPIAILALLTTFGGALGYTYDHLPLLEGFLVEVGLKPIEVELHSGFVLTPITWGAVIGALLGIVITAWIYIRYQNRLGSAFSFFKNSFYIDKIYEKVIVLPLKSLSLLITQFLEPEVFDGMIRETVHATQASSHLMQIAQSGQIRSYVAWMVFGAVFLVAYFIF